jgi:hypothetical protein
VPHGYALARRLDAKKRNLGIFDGLLGDDLSKFVDAIQSQFDADFSRTGVARLRINTNEPRAAPAVFRTGKSMLFDTRCSDELHGHGFDIRPCRGSQAIPWYKGLRKGLCSGYALELPDAKRYHAAEFYFDRLRGQPPPPRPPPKSPPPLPPAPPEPAMPPSPPAALSIGELRSLIQFTERRFCDTVYVLSSEARCNQLALALNRRTKLGFGFSPPALPPIAPNIASPPPPPSPPPPGLPAAEAVRLLRFSAPETRLSTHFLATGVDTNEPASLGNNMGTEMGLDSRARIVSSLGALQPERWAACTGALAAQGAPLPCRTGDTEARCVDGSRRCATAYENTMNPWLELDLRRLVSNGQVDGYYFFALDILLPSVEEYGQLLFRSPYENEGRGYTLTLLDSMHNHLKVNCLPLSEQSVTSYTAGLRRVQHRCLSALAEPAEYHELSRVRYIKLTLTGTYRIIWLDRIDAVFRTLRDLPPHPPPSPGLPPAPPRPVAPPDAPNPPSIHQCDFYHRLAFWENLTSVVQEEPCELSSSACCKRLYEHDDANVFTLSASGCCTLRYADPALLTAATPPTEEFAWGAAGTGIRQVV